MDIDNIFKVKLRQTWFMNGDVIDHEYETRMKLDRRIIRANIISVEERNGLYKLLRDPTNYDLVEDILNGIEERKP